MIIAFYSKEYSFTFEIDLGDNILYTGCPTKHDSMQDNLNIVLIFDIICCVYLST